VYLCECVCLYLYMRVCYCGCGGCVRACVGVCVFASLHASACCLRFVSCVALVEACTQVFLDVAANQGIDGIVVLVSLACVCVCSSGRSSVWF
jgi:hypothetical protein